MRPTLRDRLAAERKLSALAAPGTRVLCFGNLPPLFRLRAKVYLYLQNRNLLRDSSAFANGQWYTGVRESVESAWLGLRIGNVDELVVQSESMRALVAERFGREALVAPFLPERGAPRPRGPAIRTAFLYVASGDAHKNHLRLVDAWELLAQRKLKPALWLTLDGARYSPLVRSIEARAAAAGLEIRNFGHVPRAELTALYEKATALIYPSLGESYGLPLVEATSAGLPILAGELDYVREIVDPRETFDPHSALSIARAVGRFLGQPEERRPPADAHAFLQRIMAD